MMKTNSEDRMDSESNEAAIRAGYAAVDYTGSACTNCGRCRVLNCRNGKRVCEKCCFDQVARDYDSVMLNMANGN